MWDELISVLARKLKVGRWRRRFCLPILNPTFYPLHSFNVDAKGKGDSIFNPKL